MTRQFLFLAATGLALAAPAAARESLGIFGDWGAFRDAETPRCYAIAKASPSRMQRDHSPFASIGTWPNRNVRGQIHLRLSRNISADRPVTLRMSGREFDLVGSGGNAWAKDNRMDAAIVAAMRSAGSMTVRATDARGRRFSNSYALTGAATAMDAATVACAARG